MAKARAAESATRTKGPNQPGFCRLILPAAFWLVASNVNGQTEPSDFELARESIIFGEAPCARAHNQGTDLIAEYLDDQGAAVRRSGSWLGRDGRYLLPRPGGAVNRIRFRTLDASTAAPLDVRVEPCPPHLPGDGIQALASALDTRLAVYLGEEAIPDDLGDRFLEAIDAFREHDAPHWEAVAHFEYASLNRSLDHLETASAHYLASLAIFDSLGDSRGSAAALQSISLVAMRQGNKERSAQTLEQAISVFESLSDSQSIAGASNNLGLLRMRMGHLEEAAFYLNQSLTLRSGQFNLRARDATELSTHDLQQIPELTWALNTLNNLALVRWRQGAVNLAEQHWRNYLALTDHIDRALGAAQAQQNLGALMLQQGRLDEALILLSQALEQFSASDSRRWLVETRIYLSVLYSRMGDQELALQHAESAIEKLPEDIHTQVRAHRHLAEIEWRRDRLDSSISLYREALELLGEPEQGTERWATESELGHVLLLRGDIEHARRTQQRILDTLPAGEALSLAGRVRYRLAQTWLQSGDIEQAESLLNTALKNSRASKDIYYELLILEELIKLHDSDPEVQIDISKQAVERALALKNQPLSDLRRMGVSATLSRVVDTHMNLLVSQGYTDAAWMLKERNLSKNLLDSRRNGSRARGEKSRFSLLDTHANLINQLHRLQLADISPRVELADLRLRIDQIETRLRATPKSNQGSDSIGLDGARRSLDTGQLLLSYYQLPDRYLLWAVSSESSHFFVIEDSGAISKQIKRLLERLRHPRNAVGAIDSLARNLGNRLLSPAEGLIDQATELLVQPHGRLHSLPFAALIHDEHVLIDRWPVRQLLSTRPHIENTTETRLGSRSLLVFADPGSQYKVQPAISLPDESLVGRLLRDNMLVQLPGAAREAEALSRIKAAKLGVNLRSGRHASRRFLIQGGLAGHSHVHFATHGLVDLRYPRLSALLLANEGGTRLELLRPHDIARLELDAELVVLSGCETGVGTNQAGEGALSLARPFLIAGADEVISTLWKIDDTRTAVFMAAFYRHLLEDGLSTAEALAAAQREMRENRATAHPYYWAGFILTGASLDY